MKLLIITALITFVIVSGLTMLLTGTFKEVPPQGELDETGQIAGGEGESLGPLTDGVTRLLIESKEKLAEYESQIAAAEAKLAEYEKQIADSETKVTDYESRLTAVAKGLTDYEGRLAATEGKLTAIKTEAGSLGSIETPEEKAQRLAKLYGSMKPNSAAAILCELDKDLSMRILTQMSSRASGKLMDAIATTNPDYAVKISELMAKADTPGSYPKPMNN